MRKSTAELRQLILKTADGLPGDIEASRGYADGRIEALSERCIARLEFGAFTENIERQISNIVHGVVESYGYTERIELNQASIGLLQSYVTDIDGEIRRGRVTDPATGETVTGIAIVQNLQFTRRLRQQPDCHYTTGNWNTALGTGTCSPAIYGGLSDVMGGGGVYGVDRFTVKDYGTRLNVT